MPDPTTRNDYFWLRTNLLNRQKKPIPYVYFNSLPNEKTTFNINT